MIIIKLKTIGLKRIVLNKQKYFGKDSILFVYDENNSTNAIKNEIKYTMHFRDGVKLTINIIIFINILATHAI